MLARHACNTDHTDRFNAVRHRTASNAQTAPRSPGSFVFRAAALHAIDRSRRQTRQAYAHAVHQLLRREAISSADIMPLATGYDASDIS